jgi:hypothetical protein
MLPKGKLRVTASGSRNRRRRNGAIADGSLFQLQGVQCLFGAEAIPHSDLVSLIPISAFTHTFV